LSNIIYLLEVIHNLYKKVKKSAIKTESRELAWPSCYLLLAKTISLKFIKLPSDTIKAENFRGSWEKKQKRKSFAQVKVKRKYADNMSTLELLRGI